MTHTHNGTPANALDGAAWKKSRISSPNGNCVELALLPTREVAMRNSRDPNGPALIYTQADIAAFLHDVKVGGFDDLL